MSCTKFIVRKAESSEDIQFAVTLGLDIGWVNDEEYDGQIYYSADPNGLYIGELEGEKISIIIMAIYGNKELCHIGYFLVKPEYKGKGYGRKTWEYAWSEIPNSCSIALYALQDMALKYETDFGFKGAWKVHSYSCCAEKIASLSLPSSIFEIKFYGEADFDSLVDYDASIFGYRREYLIKTFLTIPCCEGWVAYDEQGKIQGHCNLMKVKDKLTWSVYPLYANNVSVARILLCRAAQFVLKKDQGATINITVPEVNYEGMELIKSVSIQCNFELIQMFARGIPRVIEENVVNKRMVFGVTSLAIG